MDLIWAIAISTHLGMEGDYNEVHPHVRFSEDGFIAGSYYNSMERISVYAGSRVEMGAAGLEFAAVTGYDEVAPISPYIRGTYDLGNVRAFAAPTAEVWNGDTNIGVVFGIEYQFK